MSEVVDHARSMLAYNRWANERILKSAAGLSPDAQAEVVGPLAHLVGTQRYWYANWTGGDFDEPAGDQSLADITKVYERSHGELQSIAHRLTDEEWNRTEAWWQRFNIDARAPLGMTLFQVIYHGIQHRAEVAITLTEHGCSPGDLDYLVFLRETVGAA